MLGAVLILRQTSAIEPASIELATTALESVCDRVLVFGAGAASDDTRPLPADTGELAAVMAALREAGGDHVAVLAADLRHPSSELLRYMAQVRGSFEAVVPEQRDGSLQPMAALYHASVLRRAEGLLAAGEREIAKLLSLCTIRRITVEEVAKFGEPERLLERS